jgi:hypothetical protein
VKASTVLAAYLAADDRWWRTEARLRDAGTCGVDADEYGKLRVRQRRDNEIAEACLDRLESICRQWDEVRAAVRGVSDPALACGATNTEVAA